MPDATTSELDPSELDLAAGEALAAQPWRFLQGVVDLDSLPPADRPEIAFAGRSNVGKSSLLNALLNHGGLARTSNTPGRTQELNFFVPRDGALFLVDMPGYGFAKAPKAKVDAWTKLVKAYLSGRPTLARVFLLIDARHGVKRVDEDIMAMLDAAAVSYQIVLTKVDKIADSAAAAASDQTSRHLKAHPAAYPHVLATSSEKGDGLEAVRATMARVVRDHTRTA